jgi:hypothetical protein
MGHAFPFPTSVHPFRISAIERVGRDDERLTGGTGSSRPPSLPDADNLLFSANHQNFLGFPSLSAIIGVIALSGIR